MSYHQLTEEERYQMSVLHKAGHTQAEMAVLLERSPATISREMRRNSGKRCYRPKQAHRTACQRGLNEQINGSIRQYLPKHRRFEDVTDNELALIEKKLNNRTRKTLRLYTPRQECQALAKQRGVALRI